MPSGITVYRSREELIETGRYWACPANELIFLTKAEHHTLHKKGNQYFKGQQHTEETKLKISESMKGKNKGENHPLYGTHCSEETRKKISEAAKRRRARNALNLEHT